MKIITEGRLDAWVRGNKRDAQGLIPELIYRLVVVSSPEYKERRFPLGDSIGQLGPDGILETEYPFKSFVPEGISYWEIGAGEKAGKKANGDYRDRTIATPEEIRRKSVFIFVTPLSGTSDWPYTWKEKSQARWIKEKRERNEWKDVQVIDGTRLIDWISHFPPVGDWLAIAIGLPAYGIETLEQRWASLREIGSPPPLSVDLFLANRKDACDKLKNVFDGTTIQLKLETHFSDQMVDFVAAYIESMENDAKLYAVGRCSIISSAEAGKMMMDVRDQQILVANFDLDDDAGTRLLDRARRVGHRVIYQGLPGGIPLPIPNRAFLPNPRSRHIQEALERSGYKIERARMLSQVVYLHH